MKKFIIFLFIVCIIALGVWLALKPDMVNALLSRFSQVTGDAVEEIEEEPIIEEKKVQIFNGNQRPFAVMIDNVGAARPQAGLNDAYIVYEIIVEGAQTRLMALFQNKNLDKIGPIRSARHYFLDYALENDAIYVHFGWSPKAQKDISSLKVNNIHGMTESSKSFWRVKDKPAPHNVVTSTKKLMQIAERKKYRTTTEKESVLNYTVDEVNLEDGIEANTITIPYSSFYKVTYTYDAETQRYTRKYNKTTQKDWVTKELVTTKNIIITFAKNTRLNDGSKKDRQNLSNVGTLNGYYITNGKAIKIKCIKESRKAQTVYQDLEGNEIEVNDGNTFIQIVPLKAKVTIK